MEGQNITLRVSPLLFTNSVWDPIEFVNIEGLWDRAYSL